MSLTHSGVKKSIIVRDLVVRKGLLRIPGFGEVIYVGFRGDSPTFACLWILIAHYFCFLFLPDGYFFPLNSFNNVHHFHVHHTLNILVYFNCVIPWLWPLKRQWLLISLFRDDSNRIEHL